MLFTQLQREAPTCCVFFSPCCFAAFTTDGAGYVTGTQAGSMRVSITLLTFRTGRGTNDSRSAVPTEPPSGRGDPDSVPDGVPLL